MTSCLLNVFATEPEHFLASFACRPIFLRESALMIPTGVIAISGFSARLVVRTAHAAIKLDQAAIKSQQFAGSCLGHPANPLSTRACCIRLDHAAIKSQQFACESFLLSRHLIGSSLRCWAVSQASALLTPTNCKLPQCGASVDDVHRGQACSMRSYQSMSSCSANSTAYCTCPG